MSNKGNAGRGRKKGVPNKDTQYLIDLCAKNKMDPALILIHIANGDWKALGYDSPTIVKPGFGGVEIDSLVIEIDHRLDAAKKLMEFIYPKRKSVEIKADENNKGFVLAYNPQAMKNEPST